MDRPGGGGPDPYSNPGGGRGFGIRTYRRHWWFLATLPVCLVPATAQAWVSTYLERVETEVELQSDGRAAITIEAWQSIEAGRLREFMLREVPPATEFDAAGSGIEDERGHTYAVELWGKRRDDGILRLRVAKGAAIPRSRVVYRLLLRQDWFATGAARLQDGALAIDWTPPVWPDGMERMVVRVRLAGDAPLEFAVPQELASELEPRAEGRTLVLSRFRPPAYYRMPVRFTARPTEVGAVDALLATAPSPPPLRRSHPSDSPETGKRLNVLPFLVVLPPLGLWLLGSRVRHARRMAVREGGVQPYLLLPALCEPLRWPLAVGAVAAGAWVLWTGDPVTGLAIQAGGLLFVLPDRFRWLERPPRGRGPWRVLAVPSPRTWASLVAVVRRSRRSWLDPTGPTGLALMLLLGAAVGVATVALVGDDRRAQLIVTAEALLLLLPPFLVASERALPPVLPGESAIALERVRQALRRLHLPSPLDIAFLVQDDAQGRPAELRLRLRQPAAKVARVAEIAVEWTWSRWGWYPTYALLLELPAGSRLRAGTTGFPRNAACCVADDLNRELWVLRTATARSAATRVLRELAAAERALARDLPSTASDPPHQAAA